MAWDDAPPTAEDLQTSTMPSGAWDASPPTAEELQSDQPAKTLGGFASNAVQNLGENVKNIATGIPHLVSDAAKTMYQVGTGPGVTQPSAMVENALQTPVAQDIKAMGPALMNRGKELGIGELLSGNPKAALQKLSNTAYQKPVDLAMDVATVAAPFMGGETAAAEGAEAPGMAEKLAAKGISATMGPPEEAVLARMENPEAIKNAASISDLSERLPSSIAKLSDKISEAEGNAWNTLGTSGDSAAGALPKDTILNVIKGIRSELEPVLTTEDEKASTALGRLASSIDHKFGDTIPEFEMKDTLKALNRSVNWDNPEAGRTNDVLKAVKGSLNGMLKAQNPEYAEAMKPVEQLVQLHDDVVSQFQMQKVPNRGWQPGLPTESKLANLLGKNKSIPQETLNRLKDVTGEDYLQDLQNAKNAQSFEGGRANGSRRVNLAGMAGGAAGSAVGAPWVGAAVGGILGALTDSYGGRMAAKIVDALKSPAFQKYIPVLANVVKQGAPAVAVTHRLLADHDPNYKAATSSSSYAEGGAVQAPQTGLEDFFGVAKDAASKILSPFSP